MCRDWSKGLEEDGLSFQLFEELVIITGNAKEGWYNKYMSDIVSSQIQYTLNPSHLHNLSVSKVHCRYMESSTDLALK